MAADSTNMDARIVELKNAPVPVKRLAGASAIFGLVGLIGFLASAFSGHVGWGRAAFNGLLQFALIWFSGIGIQDRKILGWWVLLAFVTMRLWSGLGHALRLVRLSIEGGLRDRGREIAFDVAGCAGLFVGVVVLVLLFQKAVRLHVNWPTGKSA